MRNNPLMVEKLLPGIFDERFYTIEPMPEIL
jgi:hypothetical protein